MFYLIGIVAMTPEERGALLGDLPARLARLRAWLHELELRWREARSRGEETGPLEGLIWEVQTQLDEVWDRVRDLITLGDPGGFWGATPEERLALLDEMIRRLGPPAG